MDSGVELGTLDGIWSAGAALPVGVQNAAVAVYRGEIYVAGGAGSVFIPEIGEVCCASYATVQRYDPATSRWELLGDLPEEREQMALGVVGDTLYAMGGTLTPVAQIGGARATMWAYLAETDEWVERNPLPLPRRGASAVSAFGLLLVIGGEGDAGRVSADSIAIYDPATGLWRHGAPVPLGIVCAVAHEIDGVVYVVGGYYPSTLGASTSSTVFSYDPVRDSWTAITETPGSENMFGSAVLNGRVHLVGGRGDGFAPSEYHRAYDLTTREWLQPPDLRGPRRDHAVVALNDRLYVLTGVRVSVEFPTPEMDVFELR